MMFHYGALLWGRATGDAPLAERSQLMLTVAMRAVQRYFLMQPGGGVHPAEFERNWVTGIFFENKVHHTTWFSPRLECIHGIQMLPVTPVSELLRGRSFVEGEWRELLGGALAKTTDGWRSLLLLNLASLDPAAAFEGLRHSPLDDGLLRSWALFWAATRQGGPTAAPRAAHPELAACGGEPPGKPDASGGSTGARLFASALSLAEAPGGSRHLRVEVRPEDPAGVTLVAVHYSVNGGEQWNVDIQSPSPDDGAWVHCGAAARGAPEVAPGDAVSYWLYCIRRGLGEEELGLTWTAR
ncbi:unnamed protein product [Prorocentrum cordatum]|uniref:glucan endo-1,3-beta-D-glucosidase n=1 Tax=Prorocentrum cordatum TaxID=2364126 RepID=A0ABN9V6K9_9DINO|nr:unnamed protein product [Polarella glacialis]